LSFTALYRVKMAPRYVLRFTAVNLRDKCCVRYGLSFTALYRVKMAPRYVLRFTAVNLRDKCCVRYVLSFTALYRVCNNGIFIVFAIGPFGTPIDCRWTRTELVISILSGQIPFCRLHGGVFNSSRQKLILKVTNATFRNSFAKMVSL
jgi:hypothetical protein